MIPWRSGRFRHASVISSPLFLYHSWTAMSWPRSNRRALCPPIRCLDHLRLEVLDHLNAFSAEQAERRLAPVDHEQPVDVLLREHLVERLRVELRIASIEERRDRLGRLEDKRDHLRLIRPDLFVPREDHEA